MSAENWEPPAVDQVELFGREAKVRELVAAIDRRSAPAYITVSGMAGVGKTAIVKAALAQTTVTKKYAHLFWAEAGEKPDPHIALGRWMAQIGTSEQEVAFHSTAEARRAFLKTRLAKKKILVVIEDAWSSSACRDLSLEIREALHIVTTRRLDLAAELGGAAVEVGDLEKPEAIRFLSHLAPEAGKHYPKEIERIVDRYGGLPLALRVIGRQLQKESGSRVRLHAMVNRVASTPFHVVATDPAAEPILQALDLSVAALPDAERSAFFCMAVFPALPHTFSLDAASSVAADPRAVDALVDKALLLPQAGTDRLAVHQVVQGYLTARAPRHIADAALRRMIGYYCKRVGETSPKDLDINAASMLAALDQALHRKLDDAFIDGACGFSRYLEQRGMYTQAHELLERALGLTKDPGATARVLFALGQVDEAIGRYDDARARLTEGLGLAHENQWMLRAGLHLALGVVLTNLCSFQEARQHLERAMDIARWQEDGLLPAIQIRLCILETSCGNLETAARLAHRALDDARRRADASDEVLLDVSLAKIAALNGDRAQAEEWTECALKMIALAQNEQRSCAALHMRAEVAIRFGDTGDTVRAWLRSALDCARRIGHRWYECVCLKEFGELELACNDPAEAERWFRMARMHAQGIQARDVAALATFGLARVEALRDDADGAERGRQAYEMLEAIGHAGAREVGEWLASRRA